MWFPQMMPGRCRSLSLEHFQVSAISPRITESGLCPIFAFETCNMETDVDVSVPPGRPPRTDGRKENTAGFLPQNGSRGDHADSFTEGRWGRWRLTLFHVSLGNGKRKMVTERSACLPLCSLLREGKVSDLNGEAVLGIFAAPVSHDVM